MIPDISIDAFDYPLPPERIAQYPAEVRDGSKLLTWCDGIITDDRFVNIHEHLKRDTLLVFNDTRVIRARLIFRKPTGSVIEIFCLEPVDPVSETVMAFRQTSGVTWKCLVGNLRKWKTGELRMDFHANDTSVSFMALYAGIHEDGSHLVRFGWDPPGIPFGMIVEMAGQVPLPPYIHRAASPDDVQRYQTIFALNDGSVAAPTAGLHFTDRVMARLAEKAISQTTVTLHVGIGTFKPVESNDIRSHTMHREKIVVSKKVIGSLLKHFPYPVVAVGTTSARTLESLYWIGRMILSGKYSGYPETSQWAPYQQENEEVAVDAALQAVVDFLEIRGEEFYRGETQLIITPGYRFRVISGLVTNFHMPRSTLLLLVAAIAGNDWKRVYEHALANGYRFLSYGDSCLFHLPDRSGM